MKMQVKYERSDMFKNIVDEYSLFKYFWIIALCPKVIQLILMTFFIGVFIHKSKIKIDIIAKCLLIYIIIYFFSIAFNIIRFDLDYGRIFSAFNSLTLWLVATLYYCYYKNNKINMKKICKYCFYNVVILIALAIFSLLLDKIFNTREVILLGRRLFIRDWFNGSTQLRFFGFLEYANMIIILYMLFFPFAYIYLINKKNFLLLFIFLSLLPIFLSLSRTGYVISLVCMGLTIYTHYFKKINRHKKMVILSCTMVILVYCIFKTDILSIMIENIISIILGREGSDSARSTIYSTSIQMTSQYSPIFGMGIKIRSILGYPLGSHSTYIGFYYKTGLIGILLGVSMFIYINCRLFISSFQNTKYFLVYFYLIIFSSILIFEDIDGGNWIIICYFSLLGIIMNKRNLKDYLNEGNKQ